ALREPGGAAPAENVRTFIRIGPGTKSKYSFQCAPAYKQRVDPLVKFTIAWIRVGDHPIKLAVRPGDEPVNAGGGKERYFARHKETRVKMGVMTPFRKSDQSFSQRKF